jgi:signal transduction histidine kinase
VRQLGAGDLRARVETCGNDEIASLGQSFNWTAERLERLVEGRKRVLASASHELRSPLARLRLALELARDDPQRATARLDEAVGEVAELDRLVEELLTAGRLDLLDRPDAATRVDGAAVLASEAARIGASVASSAAVELCVDERLLRTMIRNLLENAHRHGGDSAVEAGIETIEDGAGGQRIWVADRGPGIPEIERERIFEPFYRAPGQSEGQGAGVGLGLALVRRIAEHYGGSATCRPRDDGGTIFEVVLRTGAPS